MRAAATLAILMLIASPILVAHEPSRVGAPSLPFPYATPDFELMDHTGKVRRMSDYRGKVVTVVFGYTNCPDFCPTTLSRLAAAMKELGKDADKVQVLFITVDPARDTPQVLGRYVPAFNPSFVGLSGDGPAVLKAAQSFGVSFARVKGPSPSAYSVDHTAATFFLDREGRMRNVEQEDIPSAKVARELRRLLALK